MCQNCGTAQGPFSRVVLPLTVATTRLPSKSMTVLVTCRPDRARDCNSRRAKREDN